MQIIVNNTIREYSYQAILNLLRNPEFVQAYLDGDIVILGELTYMQNEMLFETMEKDLAVA
jgi:hypothetical protein